MRVESLRILGERDARKGKSINAFFELKLDGHHRYNERARQVYVAGYNAEKQKMRREMRQDQNTPPTGPYWLEAAPEDVRERCAYFARLLTVISYKLSDAQMQEAVRLALRGIVNDSGAT